MSNKLINKKAEFGTLAVFMTTISTILGAILFLRFGYAVAHTGFLGTIGIIIIGHLITIPTAFAVAEIATNQKVQGGGAYYIISRSFGMNIGGTIGIALYFSQAISVAFYVIAFSEAFDPVLDLISSYFGFGTIDNRFVSLPTMGLLALLVLTRGANVGMKALYFVVLILLTSIAMFFAGQPVNTNISIDYSATISNPDTFFYVFTIIFPAFTGLAAGLGLSGDLKNPSKSIPAGTIWATFGGLVVYIFIAYKLVISAPLEDMASDQLIMQRIAYWGPIIPIGLAAASLSSALGSILVAPRTLQAIGGDQILPHSSINKWLSYGKTGSNEPINSSTLTIVIAFLFILIGDIDFVAKIISMFFIVTYGAICLISVMEHFAADPAYRPTYKSKWYISSIGAILSIWVMFKMSSVYAILALLAMVIIYYLIASSKKEQRGLARLFKGVIFQLTRQMQIFSQRASNDNGDNYWRPFVICISKDTFKRRSAFDLLRWFSYKYGFGTYIHYIEGYLSKQSAVESDKILEKLIQIAKGTRNRVYLDTLISPSYTSAIAQVVQLSGISGRGNNTILFEFSDREPETLNDALKNFALIQTTGFDTCILSTSYKGFGYKNDIHIWVSSYDFENANLMILLAYILLGHPEWKDGVIKIFALYKEEELETRKRDILELIKSGRLPISPSNVSLVVKDEHQTNKELISQRSADADLTIIGFRKELIKSKGIELFTGYEALGNILFVSSQKEKEIK